MLHLIYASINRKKRPYIFFVCINWNFETWLFLKQNGWVHFRLNLPTPQIDIVFASVLRAPELTHGGRNWKILATHLECTSMNHEILSNGATIKLHVWMCKKPMTTTCKHLGCEGSDGSMSIEYHGYDLVQDCPLAWSRPYWGPAVAWIQKAKGWANYRLNIKFRVELDTDLCDVDWDYKAEKGHVEWTTAEPVLCFKHNWPTGCSVLFNLFERMPFIPKSYIDRCKTMIGICISFKYWRDI